VVRAGLAVVLLLVVVASQASGARRDALSVHNVEIGPVPLSKGYSLRVDMNPLIAAFESGIRPRVQPKLPLTVTISRSVGRTIERHTWNLKVAPSRVKLADGVGGIRIDTGGALGPFGRMSLTTASVGSVYRIGNCGRAVVSARHIVLKGTFRFAAGPPFGTVTLRSIPAIATDTFEESRLVCDAQRHPSCTRHFEFSVDESTGARVSGVLWPNGDGAFGVQVRDTKQRAITHEVRVVDPGRRYLKVAPDLGSFTVDASRGAPLVTGTLTMTADEPVGHHTGCEKSTPSDRSGPVTGSLTARLGYAGTRTITAGSGTVTRY
jgi:hypothetical protein